MPQDTANYTMRSFLAAPVFAFCLASVYGQAGPAEVTAIFAEEAPRIDGRLDDLTWQGIEPITDFIQIWPEDGSPPTERSEVRIAYDRDNLYFAFRFFDSEPALIRAKNLERGGRNDRDDHAYIGLDTYLDQRNAYLFEMNALGTQDDATITDEGMTLDSFSWDAVFRSETAIDDEGWSMEVSIPFRQLRFPKGDELSFGLMLSRMINRKNERVMWPRIGLEFGGSMGSFGALSAVSQYGMLHGLKGIRRGRNIEIKTLRDFRASDNPHRLHAGKDRERLHRRFRRGFQVRDFIESDAGSHGQYRFCAGRIRQRSNQSDAIQSFFPEKREFFLERSGLFEHGNPRYTQTFFSRRIGLTEQILAGARFTGQVGRFSVGVLNIETSEKMDDFLGYASKNNMVARLRTTLFPRATAGVIYTGYRTAGQQNEAVGIDAQYRFWSASEFNAWYTGIRDEVEENSAAGHASLRVQNDIYGIQASYTSVGKHYSPALGFVRRRDNIRYAGSLQYTPLVDFSSMPSIRRLIARGIMPISRGRMEACSLPHWRQRLALPSTGGIVRN